MQNEFKVSLLYGGFAENNFYLILEFSKKFIFPVSRSKHFNLMWNWSWNVIFFSENWSRALIQSLDSE